MAIAKPNPMIPEFAGFWAAFLLALIASVVLWAAIFQLI